MKCLLSGIFLLSFSFSAFAITHTTQIYSVDKGEQGEAHLILLGNGHTAFLDGESKSLLDEIEESHRRGDTVEVRLDPDLNLVSIRTVEPEGPREEEILPEQIGTYDPTVLTTSQANKVFSNMRRDYQNESQCYNRAHIWTYEEYQRSNLNSAKLFLFFTRRYIRNYRYHWWFHVAPMVYVGGSTQANWRVLDRRYTSSPLAVRSWTNIFMHNDAACPVVYKYSDYRDHQESQYCYLIPTSMYFWQPRDIERKERTGYSKTQYIQSEISHAYWEAF